jgi:hypothetical protein
MARRKRRLPRGMAGEQALGKLTIGGHVFPSVWRPADWLVPVANGEVCIQHRTDLAPDDHRLCGPILFCCLKAFELQKRYYPDSRVAQAEWRLASASDMVKWLEHGTHVMYFVFCDPSRPDGLLALGLEGPFLLDVLYKRVPIEAYAQLADRVG